MKVDCTPTRVFYLDVMRLLATLAVIMLHTSCLFLRDGTVGYTVGVVYNSFCRWCVPVFIMISGALFLRPSKKIDVKRLYSHYIVRILVAFVVWYLLYIYVFDPIRPMLHNINHHEPLSYIASPASEYKYHLWFLPMIMGLYICLPILKSITQTKAGVYFLYIWTIQLILETFRPIAILTPLFGFLDEMQLRPLLGYSGYFILGYYLSGIRIIRPLLWVAFISLTIAWLSMAIGYVSFSEGYLTPLIAIMSASIFIIVRYYFDNGGTHSCAQRLIEKVRGQLFGVYLIHFFCISLLPPIMYQRGWISILQIPIATVVVFILSCVLISGMRKIPYARYICS